MMNGCRPPDRLWPPILAPEETVGCRRLQLPHRPQPLLKYPGILKLGYLLELVDADYDIAPLFLRDLFRQLQNLVYIVAFRVHVKRYGKICHRISAHRDFRTDTRQKQSGILKPLFKPRRCLLKHGGGKCVIKFPIAATGKHVKIYYFQLIGLSKLTYLPHQGGFPPATR